MGGVGVTSDHSGCGDIPFGKVDEMKTNWYLRGGLRIDRVQANVEIVRSMSSIMVQSIS